ncbi:MAG: hypothetical protein O6761_05865 [Thaumarchaeota archaeon]|nr:hypothetical protein [Nitrososphaerota archaeon]
MDRTKSFTGEPIDELDIIEEIESEGTIFITHQWISIDTLVQVYKETDKAYFGNVTVYECDNIGRTGELFNKEKTWIPKSVADNVWWICTKLFDHPDRVANRRFDGYDR